jgi:hypothetical protein
LKNGLLYLAIDPLQPGFCALSTFAEMCGLGFPQPFLGCPQLK